MSGSYESWTIDDAVEIFWIPYFIGWWISDISNISNPVPLFSTKIKLEFFLLMLNLLDWTGNVVIFRKTGNE